MNSCVGVFIFCIGIVYAQYTLSLSQALSSDPEGFTGMQNRNNPPDVKITVPENNSFFEWNSLVRYAITVSDVEDGASEYQEIASNEVLLEVVYLPDTSNIDDYLRGATHVDSDPIGLEMIKTSDCFNCHAVKTSMAGPSFSALARRYSPDTDTVALLAHRVVKGSFGHWGNAAMPPHPDITEEQARQMVKWLLEQGGDPDWDFYVGTEGTFHTRVMPESEEKGVYVLTASYTDHGLEDKPGKRGQHTIVLRSK